MKVVSAGVLSLLALVLAGACGDGSKNDAEPGGARGGAAGAPAGAGGANGEAGGNRGDEPGGAGGVDGAGGAGDAGNAGAAGDTAGAGGSAGGGVEDSAGAGSGGAPVASACGDGMLDAGEACDDGNDGSGDGCSSTCTVESAWFCSEPGEACSRAFEERPCSADACFHQDACIEASGVTCACPAVTPQSCEAAVFRSLAVPEGFGSCRANGVSDDGTLVVGSCDRFSTDTNKLVKAAVVWRLGESPTVLDAGEGAAEATAANADGSVIAGNDAERQVFRSTSGELELISDNGSVPDMTPDGALLAGANTSGAFVWTEADGVVQLEALFSNFAFVDAVSSDGSVIVGAVGDASDIVYAARWNAERELELLDVPEQSVLSQALGVSSDGSTIVGLISVANALESRAVRWVDGEYQELEVGANASAFAVTDDGTVFGTDDAGVWLWDEITGRQSLAEALTEARAELDDWSSISVEAVTPDGSVVAGNAQYVGTDQARATRAFVAWLR